MDSYSDTFADSILYDISWPGWAPIQREKFRADLLYRVDTYRIVNILSTCWGLRLKACLILFASLVMRNGPHAAVPCMEGFSLQSNSPGYLKIAQYPYQSYWFTSCGCLVRWAYDSRNNLLGYSLKDSWSNSQGWTREVCILYSTLYY